MVDHCFIKRPVERSKEQVISELLTISGIGESYAEELYERGIRSVEDLVDAPGVPKGIQLQARYSKELQKEITASEAEHLLAWMEISIISEALKKPESSLAHILDVIPVGAHRRGVPSTHDIDVLMVCEGKGVSEAVESLWVTDERFLGTLVRGDWKFSFLWRIDRERITTVDARFCPASERGAALIHTTGPVEFNILLRKRAIKMGMSISEHGIFKGTELIHSETEEGIFTALGIPFIPVKERDTDEGRYIVTRTET